MLWQGEDGEAFGDGHLEPGGQVWRLVAIGFDQGFQLGFGTGEVFGVPDFSELAADAFSDGSGGRMMDGILRQMELATLSHEWPGGHSSDSRRERDQQIAEGQRRPARPCGRS